MKEFIFAHYKEILFVAWLFIELGFYIFLSVKKTKKKNPALAFVLSKLPDIINHFEKTDLKGHEKKKAVLSIARTLFEKEAGCEITKSISDFIDDAIEDILSTPQKKGEN